MHVARNDGLAGGSSPANLARQRVLVESLGGTYHQVVGTDVPTALLDFARGVNATQLVLGASRRGRLAQIFAPGVGVTTTADSGTIDVHLVTHEEVNRGRARFAFTRGLTLRRRLIGLALAALGLPLVTYVLTRLRGELSLPSDILLYLGAVVTVALVGGFYPAMLAAVAGFLLLNYYFTPPVHLWTIAERENILALIVFLLSASSTTARDTDTGLGPGLPAVPAPRRPGQRHRCGPRSGAFPWPGGGDGWHARPGGHARWRPYHDAEPARDRNRAGRGRTGRRSGHPRPHRQLAVRCARPGGELMTRILIVDDEPQILRALRINLHARQYDVVTAANGAEALHAAATHHPDLVVLDLGLPDIDGVEVIRKLRTWTPVPIVILSGRLDSAGKVNALDAGADDYVTKPFSLDELLARIRAVTRRLTNPDTPLVARIGRYDVDLADRRIRADDGTQVHLTPIEWQLLDALVRHPGKLVGQRQLLQQVWGPTYQTETDYVRQYMKHLRRKLEVDPTRPRHLITEPGMGYRFQP